MMRPRTIVTLGALLGFLFTSPLPGAVIYTQLSIRKDADGNVPFDGLKVGDWFLAKAAGAVTTYDADVDGNGSVDFRISSIFNGQSIGGVYATPSLGVEILGCPYPPPYANSDALGVGMAAGALIGADSTLLYSPQTGVQWGGANFLTGCFVMLTSPLTDGQGGTFFVGNEDVTGYLAFRILKDDGWHYGWLEAAGGGRGLQLYGIAWEIDPDKALIAGVIPEPSAALLVGVGMGNLLLRRKRLPR